MLGNAQTYDMYVGSWVCNVGDHTAYVELVPHNPPKSWIPP
eukprot:gene25704-22976_t